MQTGILDSQDGAFFLMNPSFDDEIPAWFDEPVTIAAAPNFVVVTTWAEWSLVEVSVELVDSPPMIDVEKWEFVRRVTTTFSGAVSVTHMDFDPGPTPPRLETPEGKYEVLLRARRAAFAESLGVRLGLGVVEQHLLTLWPNG